MCEGLSPHSTQTNHFPETCLSEARTVLAPQEHSSISKRRRDLLLESLQDMVHVILLEAGHWGIGPALLSGAFCSAKSSTCGLPSWQEVKVLNSPIQAKCKAQVSFKGKGSFPPPLLIPESVTLPPSSLTRSVQHCMMSTGAGHALAVIPFSLLGSILQENLQRNLNPIFAASHSKLLRGHDRRVRIETFRRGGGAGPILPKSSRGANVWGT